MSPKLSIVIPTLNEEHYLPLLLTDLQSQTEKDFEVIVVDAKSQDNTKKVALTFIKSLHLQFIESQKKRAAFQRNIGAKYAKSEYIFFLDADTRIDNDVIAKILQRIQKEKHLLYLPFVQPSTSSPLHRFLFFCSIFTVKMLKRIGRPISTGPHIVINKKLFESIDGFDESIVIGEDHNLIIKAYKKGVSPELIYGVGCYFSMRRFETEGTWKITREYIYYTAMTLIKGGVKKPVSEYEMGGLRYEQVKEEKK
ncbi:MAG: glycosyltransferase [Candidatus Levybacteria bacterium]|nr:glycosyltransferase [Candidatus Levybacteria bacterium]